MTIGKQMENITHKQIPESYRDLKREGFAELSNNECFGSFSALTCIDEGCNGASFGETKKDIYSYNLAGSGCLIGVEATVDLFRKNKELDSIKILTWHEGCGAANLAIGQGKITSGEKFVLELKEALEKEFPNRDFEVKKIGFNGEGPKMTRPEKYHNAMGVYINNKKVAFDFDKNKRLPPCFTIDSGISGKDIAKAELSVALDIAFGEDHGMGSMISRENPFILTCFLDNDSENDLGWIYEVLNSKEHEEKNKQGRIRFDILTYKENEIVSEKLS